MSHPLVRAIEAEQREHRWSDRDVARELDISRSYWCMLRRGLKLGFVH